jgi:hypothetical protein
MMKKVYFLLPFITLLLLMNQSCKKDDVFGAEQVPARDRGEEALAAQAEIEEYLMTHFYNYEEFENPPADFNFQIKFDTIAGENADKIPLIDQVSSKISKDRVELGEVTYKLYYLNVRQGGGDLAKFPDVATMGFEGRLLNNEIFDSSVIPVRFDLTGIINGLQDGVKGFRGASSFTVNDDGTVSFENYGIGAVFVPSGLGYFLDPPSGSDIPLYAQLIFTFHLYQVEVGDQDNDGVISLLEDLNNNQIEEDDDTDENFIPNFFDGDDDGDGRLTKNETELNDYVINIGDQDPVYGEDEVEMYRVTDEEEGTVTIHTIFLFDSNNDGTPDYLDEDN